MMMMSHSGPITHIKLGHCEFCGEKEVKIETLKGTYYKCPGCGMVHGHTHDRNNVYRQAWHDFYAR